MLTHWPAVAKQNRWAGRSEKKEGNTARQRRKGRVDVSMDDPSFVVVLVTVRVAGS